VSDDHVLDFLDVIGLSYFEGLAFRTSGVPFEVSCQPFDDGVALAGREEIILYSLETLG
jgi:hypothetical protein